MNLMQPVGIRFLIFLIIIFLNQFLNFCRSATSLTPTATTNNSSAHSPRSNYLAQKLASRWVFK